MYTIKWIFNGIANTAKFDTATEANNFWRMLKQIPGVKNMEAIKPEKKFNVVRVTFKGGVKEYTYLTNNPVTSGSFVVVDGLDGQEVVKVTSSGEMTESQLSEICPLDKFKYIAGLVVPA